MLNKPLKNVNVLLWYFLRNISNGELSMADREKYKDKYGKDAEVQPGVTCTHHLLLRFIVAEYIEWACEGQLVP